MRIVSMTGFGSATAEIDRWNLTAEVKSVNGRFLDVVTRLQQRLSSLEPAVQAEAKKHFKRGRIEVVVNLQPKAAASGQPKLNRELLCGMVSQLKSLIEEKGGRDPKLEDPKLELRLLEELGSRKEFFDSDATALDAIPPAEPVSALIIKAMQDCKAMREREGAMMVVEFNRLSGLILEAVKAIDKLAAPNKERALEKLKQRISTIDSSIKLDDNRLMQEVALLVDRLDINEELVRLRSHCNLFQQVIDAGEGGRKLEFTLQEMLREINTVGSKCQDAEISRYVVEIKNYIESMKELTLNVE